MSIITEPIGPKDIAICLALPTDINSFRHYVAKSPDKGDYLRGLVRRGEETFEDFYARCFAKVGNGLSRFVELMRQFDIEVHTDATLETLSASFDQRKVLVFAGHWKGFIFSDWDFVDEPSRILDTLEGSSDQLLEALIKIITAERPNLRTEMKTAAMRGIPPFAPALNEALLQLSKAPPAMRGGLDILVQRNPAALRERIDQELGSAVLPGNRFEMCDRFVDAYDFANALPDLREGIIDCVVCKSNHPALAIRRLRKFIQPITAEHDRDPEGWPYLIEATVRILRRSQMPYWDARKKASKLLAQLAKEIT